MWYVYIPETQTNYLPGFPLCGNVTKHHPFRSLQKHLATIIPGFTAKLNSHLSPSTCGTTNCITYLTLVWHFYTQIYIAEV